MGYWISDENQFKERLDKRVEKGKGGRECGKEKAKVEQGVELPWKYCN